MQKYIAEHIISKWRMSEKQEIPWVRTSDLEDMDLPRPVVLINGAFDVLSSGHMKIICVAKAHGASVVCGLDGDEKIRLSKGEGRPILNWVERAVTLNYMPIDYIVEINTTHDMTQLIAAIDPDYRVQGSEYKNVPTRYPWIPKIYVKDTGVHTSVVVERILKANELRNRRKENW
jgi:bifunctional ADP-heptose synthase (sugar kinase/adenylyltransferase)